jgi:hypothetical protein
MFPFFSKKSLLSVCPVSIETQGWVETKFKWLIGTFGEQTIRNKKILIPHYSDFPFDFNGDPEPAHGALAIIASQMELNEMEFELFEYPEGSDGGKFLGYEQNKKYYIGLERQQFSHPENLVATLAHELAQIKLLEAGILEQEDERFTELTTLVFGLGIFNANEAFRTFSGMDYMGWSPKGGMTQMEWGYALAIFARLRPEEPYWIEHLSAHIKADFKKSLEWLQAQK